MTGLPAVPSIFWTTLLIVFGLTFWTTIVGRQFTALLPSRLRPIATFYLAPSLGLALLTVIASLLGRWLPLGNSIMVPLAALAAVAWAIFRDPARVPMLRHAAGVSLFSLACGSSLLVPLLVYGAFNAHNDAFTYLAHSDWLQVHSFSEKIVADSVTPLTTQIMLYQQLGFRMGASFVLGFVQAISAARWAYTVYPAVVIVAVSACCLSIGFPIAHALRRLNRGRRLLVLAFPAFGYGGLTFAANFGFLPQTLGITFACALLFLFGPLIESVSRARHVNGKSFTAGFIIALLLSALTMAYSELVPFVGLALAIIAIVLMIRNRSWLPTAVAGLTSLAISLVVLNSEIERAYNALKLQSGAVVGAPVPWSLAGFIAHAMGVHGGAWDIFQWSLPHANAPLYLGGCVLFVLSVALTGTLGLHKKWRLAWQAALLPSSVMLAIFAMGLAYFRYGVVSPFPVGTGQSWSQFKLADWAHPFVSAFALLALVSILPASKTILYKRIVALLFAGALAGSSAIAMVRISPYVRSYEGSRDVARFYTDFREAVLTTCRPDAPIYLALAGRDEKFKQIATIYFPDRYVLADWTGDVYIEAWLPESQKHRQLAAGQCIVERQASDQMVTNGRNVGSFAVGQLSDEGRILIQPADAAHERESDGKNWWLWTEKTVTFKVRSLLVTESSKRTRITFNYQTRGPQTLTMRVAAEGTNAPHPFTIISAGEALATFDEVVDVQPSAIRQLEITTNGQATPLGAPDTRSAAWRILDLHLEAQR